MAESIQKCDNIEGFNMGNKYIKITQLGDDTTIMIKKSIPYKFHILKQFETCSGLKANIVKTKAFNVGPVEIVEPIDFNMA